jgi:hypothetical protein
MSIWSILWLFGKFCVYLVHFMVKWYIFPRFGMLCQEKSGNPVSLDQLCKINRVCNQNRQLKENGVSITGLPDGIFSYQKSQFG